MQRQANESAVFGLAIAGIVLFLAWGACPGATLTVGLGGAFPYNTIQSAIDAAIAGDTVLVTDGTYTGTGNRDIDFLGKAITVRSQNGAGSTFIDCERLSRGFYFHTNETNAAVLDGLTIRNGFVSDSGGGICVVSASPTIVNCRLMDNYSINDSGGIYAANSRLIFGNNLVTRNAAGRFGGGGEFDHCQTTIRNCQFTANTSFGNGGGLSVVSGNVSVDSSFFAGNYASDAQYGDGGGLWAYAQGGTISGCTFVANRAAFAGGAIDLHETNQSFVGNIVVSNWSGNYGGGVRLHLSASRCEGNIIAGNQAANRGSGISLLSNGPASAVNNLVVGNWNSGILSQNYTIGTANAIQACTVANNGGIGIDVRSNGGEVAVVGNSIVFGNAGGSIAPGLNIAYSDVEGGCSGAGNIDADPAFVGGPPGNWSGDAIKNPAEEFQTILSGGSWTPGQLAGKFVNPDLSQPLQFYVVGNDATTLTVWGDASAIAQSGDPFQIFDYHLMPLSPCVDAGCDVGLLTDLDGRPRPFDMPGVDHNGGLSFFDMGAYEAVPLTGDADLDGCVGFRDYQVLEQNFGMTTGAQWADGDFDGDGAVNFADYQALEQHFGQSAPEPGALSLLGLGGLALLRRRGV